MANRCFSPKSIVASAHILLEAMDTRRHNSVSYSTSSYEPTTASGYYGAILFGNNGDDSGMPTAFAGLSDEIASYSFNNWDADVDDGVDSGELLAVFALNTTSYQSAVWNVAGQASEFTTSSLSGVNSVQLVASVYGGGLAFGWRDVTVNFYNGSSLVESVSLNDFSADTRSSLSWDPMFSTAVITPTSGNVTGVTVSGKFQMQADVGTYPGITDMRGQILVS